MILNFLFLFTSLTAGALTILAPSILPVLPVIVGAMEGRRQWHPFILTTSLAISVIVFTLLLKTSTLLINVPQIFWQGLSGGILLVFGFLWLFSSIWEWISVKLNFLNSSQAGLMQASHVESSWSAVLMGAALGPVFNSCSPTYFVILDTILPVSLAVGLIYLFSYGVGLALILGLIAFFGRKITAKLGWTADPNGLFKKVVGLILVLVGLAVITGFEKQIEMNILNAGFGVTTIENQLLDATQKSVQQTTQPAQTQNGTGTSFLPILFEAPELAGLTGWINSKPILSMQKLRGKVVLVDFWTYSCINCIRTLPYLQSWHEKYAGDGLVILGFHAPEFQFERVPENVQKAVSEFGLTYPVVQDNDFSTWRAYNNRYWPAQYLVDQNGRVRYTHFGEGAYEETEKNIVDLLKKSVETQDVEAPKVDFSKIGTPETYLGLLRRENYVENASLLNLNEWTLTGLENWQADDEKVTSSAPNSTIRIRFKASRANLVMGGTGSALVKIDGAVATPQDSGKDVHDGKVTLNGERLYELTDFGNQYEPHEIEIIFDQAGAELFAWTFG